MAVVLLDIFLTVLYARAGTALFSPVVSRAVWFVFRLVSRPFDRNRGKVLSFCGPVILVALIFVWAAALALGSALIMHPHLGGGIRASEGSTPRDFMSALFAAASSLSFVGSSDFKPQSARFQALYMFNSLIGMSVISLVLTYMMQIYSALKTRNALGLAIQTLSDESGDAAELIAGLGTSRSVRFRLQQSFESRVERFRGQRIAPLLSPAFLFPVCRALLLGFADRDGSV